MTNKVETNLFASLIRHKLKKKKILVAVSGGLDSVCLLHALHTKKEDFRIELVVGYVHHGPSENKKTHEFRENSEAFVKTFAKKYAVSVFTVQAEVSVESENDLREFRYEALRSLAEAEACDVIAVAHHRDDLLESRVIRLIRGVGKQGLEAMSELRNGIFRPFLSIDREDLEKYARTNKLKFLNDPSNLEPKFFRNWLRNEWLPTLEAYRPGAKRALSKSLENLASVDTQFDPASLVTEEGISRSSLLELAKVDQRRVIAHYLRYRNVKDYTSSQIDEILKRLDTSQKALTFRVIGLDWTVDTRHIRCLTS